MHACMHACMYVRVEVRMYLCRGAWIDARQRNGVQDNVVQCNVSMDSTYSYADKKF